MVLLAGLDSETILPPLDSGFSQTVINGLNLQDNKLQNIILPYIDAVPPVILSGPTVNSITDTSAVIAWQTDEKAAGEIRYGVSSPPTIIISETAYVTHHSEVLTGLAADTEYFVQVTASDSSGNGPVESNIVSFRTKPVPDTMPPVILEGPIVTAITHNTALVQWKTDEPSVGTLEYGYTQAFGGVETSALAVDHQVTLSGLSPETLYSLKVSSVDSIGNGPSQSAIVSFNTIAAPDTTAPVIIEGPMILDISDTGATVFWTTDEPATSGVSYNDGTAYGVYQDDALVTEHTVKLTGLTAQTLYELTVSSKDGSGNGPTLSDPNSFTTLAPADTNPPVIVESPLIVNITHQSVVIRWETDETANGVIEYGLAADQLSETESHAALKKPHNMTITGLEAGIEYFFRVLSTDSQGNGPVASSVYSFTTDLIPSNKQPHLTKQPEVIHKDDDQITITWETDEPTDTVVEYEGADGEKKRRSDGEKEQKHQVTLVGLVSDTNYSISILSTDGEGNQLLADIGKQPVFLASTGTEPIVLPTTVLTDTGPDAMDPMISQGPDVIGVSDTTVTLRWVTDEIADSLVSYGLQGQSLNMQAGDIKDVFEHIVVLTNLSPNTSYDFQVASTDANGNGPTLSSVMSFTTGTTSDSSGPVFSTSPSVSLVSDTGVVIEWSTDEAATAVIRFGTTSGNLNQSAAVDGLGLSRNIIINNLVPGTTYYFAVEVTDSTSNFSTSSESSFVTTGVLLSNSHTVSFDLAGGTRTGGGNLSQTITHGQAALAPTFTAPLGKNFNLWSTTFDNITADTTVTAEYVDTTYIVTFTSGGNGTLSGTDSQTINFGSSASQVTANPATNYHFVNWTGTNGFVTTSANPLTVTGVTSSQVITANFSEDAVNGTCGSSNGGTFTVSPETNLCSSGIASLLTGTGPWNWSCGGSYGGTVTTCEANLADTIQPILTVSTLDGHTTNVAALTVSGTASDNTALATLTVNGAATTVTNGNYSHPITLLPGNNTITVIATDSAGNQTTDTRTVILDQTAPSVTITTPTDNSSTATAQATVTGSCGDATSVAVKINSGSEQVATISDGAYTLDFNLTQGQNTITVTAFDALNNSSSVVRTVTYDAIAPTVTITLPDQDSTIRTATYQLNGSVSDALGTVTVTATINGQPVTATLSSGTFTIPVTFTTESVYQVIVTATDTAGNSASAIRNLTYDDYPIGDADGDGVTAVFDALLALKMAVGQAAPNLAVCDVAPLINGVPAPDGKVTAADALVILRKAVGLW